MNKPYKHLTISVFAVIFLLSPAFVKAQTLGIKGGYTDAWQHYGAVELPPNAETHIKGFHIAIEWYRPINKYFSVGIEPGYVKRGAACVPGWNGGIVPEFRGDTEFLLNYVEAPICGQLNLPLFQTGFSIFAKAGYGVSYIGSAFQRKTENIFGRAEPRIAVTKMDLQEGSILNRWDHGAYAGAGLSYSLNAHQVFFEFDFYNGLRDAERFNTSKNRDMDFSLGYRFVLNRI